MKKSKNRIKILFIYPSLSSFIKDDLEILKKYFIVKPVEWKGKKSIFKLLRGVIWADVTFSWFASDHAFVVVFFSKLFGKKSIVVVGGFEVAYLPEINYGRFIDMWHKRRLTMFVLKHTDLALAVSNFTKNNFLKRTKPKRIEVVYNGVDIDKFKPAQEKENTIVTVGNVTEQGIKLKGLETFAKASINFPDCKFVIIGSVDKSIVNELKKTNPNLVFTNQIAHDNVLRWFQHAKVYCQLSYVESFGMSVAEAMSCGCIPVVTDRGGLPEVVGDTGFYVFYGNEKATAEAIKKALDAPDEVGGRARERIKEKFPMAKREKELIKIIYEVMKCKSQ